MKTQKVTRITFEALGKEYVAYTESADIVYITNVIESITSTAFLKEVSSVIIDKDTFLLNNLENIVKWNESLNNRFKDNELK